MAISGRNGDTVSGLICPIIYRYEKKLDLECGHSQILAEEVMKIVAIRRRIHTQSQNRNTALCFVYFVNIVRVIFCADWQVRGTHDVFLCSLMHRFRLPIATEY
jgi:hypothetical protein